MKVVEEEGMGLLEIFALPTDEGVLQKLLSEVFGVHWAQIRFGPLIQGAVYEIAAPNAPHKMTLFDGYFTVDFGAWHLHLCIGAHRGSPDHPVSGSLALRRRTARAELYRIVHQGAPTSWGLRLFNGDGEQQLTVILPNPFLSHEQGLLPAPDWRQLALWDHLRSTYLGLDADPRDRLGTRFVHG